MKYTPNRWLVLAITLLVTARVLYGFWRGWEAWRASLESAAWVTASGVAGSLSAGAVVLGYYLVFWWGVRRRVRRHERT
jgi:TRAP-type C4-dicarboxylate transport system permease small subunit